MAWKLLDAAKLAAEPLVPPAPLVEDVFAPGDLGIAYGRPKIRKSLLVLDLAISVVCGLDWLDQFQVEKANVLYVATDDGERRFQARIQDILPGYDLKELPQGRLTIACRSLDLTDGQQFDELVDHVRQLDIGMLVLDVFNQMMSSVDENRFDEVAPVLARLRSLARDENVAILLVDHPRKPTSGRYQANDYWDLLGSAAKFAMADFVIKVTPEKSPDRLRLTTVQKDYELGEPIIVRVSPQGSGEPKFHYVGTTSDVQAQEKALRSQKSGRTRSHKTQDNILKNLDDQWISRGELERRSGVASTTLKRHLADLVKAGKVERKGDNRKTVYRLR